MASVTARRNRDGSVSWRVQARDGGKMLQESFVDEDGARKFGAVVDRVGFRAARATLKARSEAPERAMTLHEWADHWLEPSNGYLVNVTPGTIRSYRLAADRTFLAELGELPLVVIKAETIGRWIHTEQSRENARTGKPVSAKTMRNYHAVLSAMLTAASTAGHITGNPARGVKMRKGTRTEMVLISPAEFELIHKALPKYARPLARFLAGTGMRWGEATALTWSDIDLTVSPATARVTKAWKRDANGGPVLGQPKTEKSVRTVSLPPQVVAEMGAAGHPDALVFPGPDGIGQHRWNIRFHRDAWRPAVEASKIGKKPRVHDLRHAQSSWLIARGVPLPFIQQRLGHEKISTTVDTYGHLAPEAHEQMALVMDRVFGGAKPPQSLPSGPSGGQSEV